MRFTLSLIGFFGFCIQTALVTQMNVAIKCMVNTTQEKTQTKSNCKLGILNLTESGPYDWSREAQDGILSSFYLGYMISQLASGRLAYEYGGKLVCFVGMFFGSALATFQPFYAQIDFGLLIMFRLLMGLLVGCMWPCMYSLWPQWILPKERGRRMSLGMCSIQLGYFVSLALAKSMCKQGYGGLNNIGAVWFILGPCGLMWCFFWLLYVYDTPDEHRIMYKSEKIQLLKENFHLMRKKFQHKFVNSCEIPWREAFSSPCVLSLVLAHFVHSFAQNLIFLSMWSYFENVLRIDISENIGLMSASFIGFSLICTTSGILSDVLIESNVTSITQMRRIFNTIGFGVPMIAFTSVAFVDCSQPYVAFALVSIAIAFFGCLYGGGYFLTIVEISGIYSGVIMGIVNALATLSAILLVYFRYLLELNTLEREWSALLLITSLLLVFGLASLLLFSKSELETWAVTRNNEFSSLLYIAGNSVVD